MLNNTLLRLKASKHEHEGAFILGKGPVYLVASLFSLTYFLHILSTTLLYGKP